jgi:long-chain acyl-CoA synthetase
MAAVTLFFSATAAGCVAVVVPFDPNGVLAAIERHRITMLLAMPALYRMLAEAQAAQPRDLSTLRACLVGGDSAPAALHEQCVTVLGVPLIEGYGLTEAVPIAFNGGAVRRPGSLGRALPQIEWRLIDDRGCEVRPGEVGQVTVRSALVCAGYWNDRDATAAAIKDGWLHTGDLARQDADGFYWFAGRSKEIIIRGGSNVSPQEVEEALYQHPAVREAAVVGKPDERWGEVIVAFIALKDGASLTKDELIAFAAGRIAAYKVPETIVFEPALPKGPTGKVARRPLRERFTS